MGHLTLLTLGTPEVRHAGAALAFRTRKALALLIYLAVEPGLHSREQLTALFWPESDAAHGRAMLRRTLAFLRDTLGDSAAPPGQAHLLVARATLGFNPHADFSLDTQPFVGARTPEQLQAAVGAYRGDFLADFLLGDAPEFDDWVARRREAWHTQIAGILDRLSQAQIAAGDAPAAQASLARWLALDPLNETAYLRRIRLHLAAGDRSAALRVYEAARAQLAQELGLAPSPALAALAERIRLDTPVPAPATALRPAPVPRPPLQAPLVGRGAEFVKLVERYHLAHRDGLHVVLVEGEAGIGKTRLAREFLGWAQAHDIDVWAGQALETGGRIPYQPLVEALRRRLEGENAPADLLSDIWLAELSRLLPELRDRYPDLAPPPADESAAGARLFEAVTRLGLALTARTAAVLFLDDLQWADAASLDLLQYALRRWAEERARLMVLLTLRVEAPAEQPALVTWLAAVRREAPITAIALGPLSQADTVRWVQALGQGGPVPPAGAPALDGGAPALVTFGDWLFAQTGGQPFYISETLQALTAQGAIVFPAGPAPAIHFAPGAGDPAAWGRLIPAGVREVVRGQLARLGPPAFGLLAAGAVLGHDFRFEQLCAVADLPEPEALAALDAVLHAHLWREAGGTPPAYAFTHDTIRDVVYDEAGAARRRIFHRRALVALQPAAAPPAVLAHHALQAGLVGPACHFSLLAGDGAMRVFAVRDAIGYYGQAHALAGPPPGAAARPEGVAPGEWPALLRGLGRAYEFVNDWSAADAVYGELLAFGRQAADAEAVCLALNRLAAVAYQGRFDLRRAEGLLHEARAISGPDVSKALRVETDWNLAQLNFYVWHLADALVCAERARLLAEELGQPELVARCRNTSAFSKMMLGHDWRRVVEEAAQARALFATLGNRAMEADALSMIAIMNVQGGRFAAGIAAAQEGVQIAQAAENAWGQANCAWPLARALYECGDFSAALAAARAGVAAARAAGHPPSLVFNLAVLGRIYGTLGDWEAARAAHTEGWHIAAALPPHPLITEWAATELCADAALAGEWATAYEYARRVRQVRDYQTVYAGPGRWYETAALVRAGAAAAAAEDLARFGAQLAQLGWTRRYQTDYLRARAVLAEAEGDARGALAYLREAGDLAAALGMLTARRAIYLELARLQRDQGQGGEAAASWEQAQQLTHVLAEGIPDPPLRATFLQAVPRA